MLGDLKKSFAEFPDTIQFVQIPAERVFQQQPLLPAAIWKYVAFIKARQLVLDRAGRHLGGKC